MFHKLALTNLRVLPLVIRRMMAQCPTLLLTAHCFQPTSMSTVAQQMPWPKGTQEARNAKPIQHQVGATPLENKDNKKWFFLQYHLIKCSLHKTF